MSLDIDMQSLDPEEKMVNFQQVTFLLIQRDLKVRGSDKKRREEENQKILKKISWQRTTWCLPRIK